MSIHTHDILSAISEAQSALNREPEYKTRISDLEAQLSRVMSHNQGLELNIAGYKGDIAELQSKVRSLEVERDDAGFRLLETEDTLASYRIHIEAFNNSIAHLMPLAPAPVVASAASEVEPQSVPITEHKSETEVPVHATADNVPSGERATDPTVAASQEPSSPTANSVGADAISSASPVSSPKPYEGKTYSQIRATHEGYISYIKWVDGGGTYDNYYQ